MTQDERNDRAEEIARELIDEIRQILYAARTEQKPVSYEEIIRGFFIAKIALLTQALEEAEIIKRA